MIPSQQIAGLKLLEPKTFQDSRGRFSELFRRDDDRLRDEQGQGLEFLEDSLSTSRRGVLRGLHGDHRTWKLMQCVAGEIFLVVVDLRCESSSFRQWTGLRLPAEEPRQVLVPPGCVNGHLVLRDAALFYKQTAYYQGAGQQVALRWDDPTIGIRWPLEELDAAPILSDRDASTPWLETLSADPP
ncbi:MAG: dTDP-4-dehydrorhamnose 3,5-epimerase [Deltaproteobacteria bacterium]|nr:dTDP-4-dehydrorhamnose 3,5-epimerase [Deltaproteobacteria bacterium]